MSEVKRTKLGPVSAYAIAVKNGFEGTEKEWLAALAARDYMDKTEDFHAQSEYLRPMDYLRSLGPGAWKMEEGEGWYALRCGKMPTGTLRHEKNTGDNGYYVEELWLDDVPVYRLDGKSGEMSLAGDKLLSRKNVELAEDEAEESTLKIPSLKKLGSMVVQESGQEQALVMSQRAVTQIFDQIAVTEVHRPQGTAALATTCMQGVIAYTTSGELYRTKTFPVYGGVKYHITGSVGYKKDYYAFFDAQGNVLSYLEGFADAYKVFEMDVLAPVNAAKIVLNYLSILGEPTVVSESSYGPHVRREDFEALKNQTMPYSGLRWAVFGDSLTVKSAHAAKAYYDYIQEELGCGVINYGLGGSGYKKMEEEEKAFYQRILTVDPSAFDVLTIFGSGNDLSLPLGQVTDTGTDTICGCINTTLDRFYQIAPDKVIGLVTPTPWYPYPQSNVDNVMEKYADAIMEIGRRRGIPCLDLYHCSGLRPWDDEVKLLFYNEKGVQDSGVHPNSEGHKKFIYPHFREFLKTLA